MKEENQILKINEKYLKYYIKFFFFFIPRITLQKIKINLKSYTHFLTMSVIRVLTNN